jgi:FAD/FMN-containing dehydrogenase
MRLSKSTLYFFLVLGVTASDSITQPTVCGELASVLSGRVFLPDAPTYNASITTYPFLQLRLHPSCIVRPSSAQDVSVALNILKQNNDTRFAVKGGGHNANAGFNNIDNGVTIDMQSMKTVQVERGDKVVRVAAGALSQDAYDAAEKRNLTVLAGRIGVVGTAGFLTGGMSNRLDIYTSPTADLLTMDMIRWCLVLFSAIRLGLRCSRKLRSGPCKRGDCERERNIQL